MKQQTLTRLLFLLLCLPGLSCMEEEPYKLAYSGFTPQELQDGWSLSTPEQENMSRSKLNQVFSVAYREERFRLLRSITIIRNGNIVAESYAHDPQDIGRIQNVKSVTKSFTSILTGIALQRKVLDSLTQPFSTIFPEYFSNRPEKRNITIEHALTMKTGLQYNDEEHHYNFYFSNNIIEYVLSSPLNGPPGQLFSYSDDNPTLVSYAIQRKYGKSMAEFAREYLFTPLGITDWQWESSRDGVSFGGSNFYLKPRDMAKFGQMLLQNGKWQGRQIVDSTWIAEATRDRYANGYGYYFWLLPDLRSYCAAGHGGQYIIVVPYKNLVVVVTAWPYMQDTDWLRDNFLGTLLKDIINACS
jgi:CubicO group peptidase (beta-lactamase class C family)